jgi:hypothetical protein
VFNALSKGIEVQGATRGAGYHDVTQLLARRALVYWQVVPHAEKSSNVFAFVCVK